MIYTQMFRYPNYVFLIFTNIFIVFQIFWTCNVQTTFYLQKLPCSYFLLLAINTLNFLSRKCVIYSTPTDEWLGLNNDNNNIFCKLLILCLLLCKWKKNTIFRRCAGVIQTIIPVLCPSGIS